MKKTTLACDWSGHGLCGGTVFGLGWLHDSQENWVSLGLCGCACHDAS